MGQSNPQKRFSGITKCGHCGNSSPMEVVSHYSQVSDKGDGADSYDCGDIFDILLCPACNKIILRTYFYHEYMESEKDTSSTILYPVSRDSLLGLPAKVEKAYLAALKVRNVDVNAYGVLIGRVLELICEDRFAKGKDLNEKLKDLSAKGEIPDKLVNVAVSLRKFRNIGAHPSVGELTIREIPLLDDLCRAILEYVYSAPHLVKKAEKRLSQLKKTK